MEMFKFTFKIWGLPESVEDFFPGRISVIASRKDKALKKASEILRSPWRILTYAQAEPFINEMENYEAVMDNIKLDLEKMEEIPERKKVKWKKG